MHPLTTLILITLLNLPVLAYGAEYKALVGIPGVTDPNADFSSYINSLYVLSISVAALLAVIKIVIAGMKYMLTDIVTSKGEAKKDVQGALIGLLVVLAAVLILTVINPKITNTAITFEKLPTLKSPVAPVVVGGGGGSAVTAPKTTAQATPSVQVTSLPSDTSADQKQLFKNECAAQPNATVVNFNGNWGETPRCVTHGANETVSAGMVHCTSASCTTVIQSVIDDCEKTKKGYYYKDTLMPDKGFCVYPTTPVGGGTAPVTGGGTPPVSGGGGGGGGTTPTPGGGSSTPPPSGGGETTGPIDESEDDTEEEPVITYPVVTYLLDVMPIEEQRELMSFCGVDGYPDSFMFGGHKFTCSSYDPETEEVSLYSICASAPCSTANIDWTRDDCSMKYGKYYTNPEVENSAFCIHSKSLAI